MDDGLPADEVVDLMTDGGEEPSEGTGTTSGDGPSEDVQSVVRAVGEETADDGAISRCDFCRLPIPKAPVTLDRDGDTYRFCSVSCRDALQDREHVFTEYHGNRRFEPGVSALDASLPQGIPRNSFVMLTDLAGTRTEAIQAELAWRALQRGEPVVIVSFLEPPVSVIQGFATLEWNVLPYLEDGQLTILDCFTYRVDDRERMFDRLNRWNSHLSSVAEDATVRVRDPSEVSELHSRLDSALEDNDMADRGIVLVDSLTEVGSLIQPVRAYDFLKDLRADVCKGRFVPVFAGATLTGAEDQRFPHDLTYMVDGIVEMRVTEEIIEGALIKQLRVRKMSGVLTYPEWCVYEYTAGEGIVTFDPVAQAEAAKAEAEDEAETSADAENGPDGEQADAADGADGEQTDDEDGADG